MIRAHLSSTHPVMNQQLSANIEVVDYQPEYGLETVKMWRQSFQRAMGLQENNAFEPLCEQLAFFSTIDTTTIKVAIDTSLSVIVGLWVQNGESLEHLYVHVDYQGAGLGQRFMGLAKAASPSGITLYTFQKNHNAQRFYLRQGFAEIGRDYADMEHNPWATSKAQLADIQYRWDPGNE